MALRRFHGLSNNLRALQIRKLKDVKGRVIIVGDVHGCVNELNALVERCGYNKAEGDVLIIVGDFVNKGYDSVAVVKRCIELGAYGVLGNHDFTLLHVADAIASGHHQEQIQQQLTGSAAKKDAVVELAVSMPHACMAYLRQLPHIIRIPQHNVLVVHAGINVAVPIERQDVFDVMHIRTLAEGRDGILRGSYGGKGQLWAELYEGPEQIVFGHDARTGFRQYKHALALDSGCVYGNSLTAVVYGGAGVPAGKGEVVSVPSKFNVKNTGSAADAGSPASLGVAPATPAATVATRLSAGDSPTPLVMNTHAVQQEIQRGFSTQAVGTPLTLTSGNTFTATSTATNRNIVVSTPGSVAFATPPSLPAAASSARAVPIGASSAAAAELAVMTSTIKAFMANGMVDSIALLSRVPSYAARWEDVLSADATGITEGDWVAVVEQLFVSVSEIANGTFSLGPSSPSSPIVSPEKREEDRLEAYLNLITDIIDARGPEVAENVVALASAACEGAKKRYPSQGRLIKQVLLALP